MYFPRNWEFGSALSKLRNFGKGGLNTPNTPSARHCTSWKAASRSTGQNIKRNFTEPEPPLRLPLRTYHWWPLLLRLLDWILYWTGMGFMRMVEWFQIWYKGYLECYSTDSRLGPEFDLSDCWSEPIFGPKRPLYNCWGRVLKTNSMHCLSSVYFVNQPLHVLGIFVAHHQEVYCIYTAIGMCCAFSWLSVGRNM
jgi:hypothetical protein